MKYMIHACPEREWYVNEFLTPSLLAQGISSDDIYVWHDEMHKGNLVSCQESFRWCFENLSMFDGVWHLQDDVVISSRFKELTEAYTEPFQNGFCCDAWEPDNCRYIGPTVAQLSWVSFQCVYIKNDLALEFADWVDVQRKKHNALYEMYIKHNKHDDVLFAYFLRENHRNMPVVNIYPNIVDHIDYLIGGSSLNEERRSTNNQRTSWYWYEPQILKDLEANLEARAKKNVPVARKRRSNDKSGKRTGS